MAGRVSTDQEEINNLSAEGKMGCTVTISDFVHLIYQDKELFFLEEFT